MKSEKTANTLKTVLTSIVAASILVACGGNQDAKPVAKPVETSQKSPQASFDAEWEKIAKEDPEKFAKLQNDYTKPNFYKPAVAQIKEATGLDVEDYSYVLKSVVRSAAVQHGAKGAAIVFKNAGVDPSMNEKKIIKLVYDERGKNEGKKYFYSSSDEVQKSVSSRLKREKQDALKMYEELVN